MKEEIMKVKKKMNMKKKINIEEIMKLSIMK